MAERGVENAILAVGVAILVLLAIGLTYYMTKTSMQLVSPPSNQTNSSGQIPTITATGEATETVTQDLLSVGITVQTSGQSASDSEATNAAESAKVKEALLAAGLNESEIQTESYSTSPLYNESCYECNYGVEVPQGTASAGSSSGAMIPPYPCRYDQNCTLIGYQTTNTILVNSGHTDKGGKYIDAVLSSSNSTSIDYVYFSMQDKTRIQLESALQVQAAASAKGKADSIAKGLGVTVGKIISVNPNYSPIYPMYAYENSGTKAAPPTQISPTTTTLSSSVTVVYELVQ